MRAFTRSAPLLVSYEHIHADRFPVDCPVVPLYPRGSWRARWNARTPAWLAGDPLARFDVPRARRALAAHETRVLHAHFGWAFLRKWLAYIEADGFAVSSSEYFLDAAAGIVWRFHPQWDLSFGVRFYAVGIDRSDLRNELELRRLFFGLAYSW